MKTTIYLLSLFGLILFSCQSNDSAPVNAQSDVETKDTIASMAESDTMLQRCIMMDHLQFDNNMYYFDIDRDGAKELGVSDEIYKKCIESISRDNDDVARRIARGETYIYMKSKQSVVERYLNPETVTSELRIDTIIATIRRNNPDLSEDELQEKNNLRLKMREEAMKRVNSKAEKE